MNKLVLLRYGEGGRKKERQSSAWVGADLVEVVIGEIIGAVRHFDRSVQW